MRQNSSEQMMPEDIRFTFQLPEFCAAQYKDEPAFFQKNGQEWKSYSYKEYYNISIDFALYLLNTGMTKGDNIATAFSFNCPQWNFLDMALSFIGAVHVPIYPTISDSDYIFILNQIETKFIFVSDNHLFERINNIKDKLSVNPEILCLHSNLNMYFWEDNYISSDKNKKKLNEKLIKLNKTIVEDDIVSIVYTSGTTGFPKGVMLSHKNLVTNTYAASLLQPMNQGNRILSFLPLCHVYERTANYQFQLKGTRIYYCDSLKSFMPILKRIKPEGITVVPRVLEKTIKFVLVAVKNRNLFVRMFTRWAVNHGYRYDPAKQFGKFYNFWHRIAYIAVFQKVRNSMGGELKYIGCGGAHINPKIKRFFWAAQLPVYEGYGLTECSPLVTLNSPGCNNQHIESVGPVIPGTQIKLTNENEILCKGPNVTSGYYKSEELNKETIVDGWLHTGDLGDFIEGRFLKITGRKKQMFKTSFGKYIVPQAIENKFLSCPQIDNIIIVGEGRYCAAAIISPAFDFFRKVFPHLLKLPNRKIANSNEVHKAIQKEINKVNKQLGKTEQIKKYLIVPDTWSIESGELSATLKLKRSIILKKYKSKINALYSDDSI